MDSHLITEIEKSARTLLFNNYEKRLWNVASMFQHQSQQLLPICVLQHNIDIIVCDIFENTIYTLRTLLDIYNIDSVNLLKNLYSELQANRKCQIDFIIKTAYAKHSSGKYIRTVPVFDTITVLKIIYHKVIYDLIIRNLKLGETCKVISQS